MSKKLRRLAWRLLAAVALSAAALPTLTSCGDEYYDGPYYSTLSGTWQLTGVSYYNTNEFTFYGDGTGYYSAYDAYGNWQSWMMTYTIYGSRLTVYLNSGQVWTYNWSIAGNMLTLVDLQVPGNILYYQYVY